ncbi:DUF5107 domain-containing protein [Neobacillus mesonae]|nr:DUF5107 domain-containing protein [Neobacillus mesonae]
MTDHLSKATVREEVVQIPTYGVGKPDKNPMFLEKRVYQGSSGRVYPHPVIDKIKNEKKMQDYRMIILENDYLRIEIMPELGGRIYRALDKTNNYDFVYYNQVIKPALVGLTGPWISGGIEFNWPQHHRPNTFGAVESKLEEINGRATAWVSEIDRMYGTKVTTGFTLYSDKAYIEIKASLYNRTSEPQTFLWWANPAVAVNDYTQSIFPPDVSAVFDHGKRDVSRFPIATGTYYKMDYSEGVDISRYKNIPVPTSYMAYKSDYDFIGGYDHRLKAGLLHVANHHISPGKKQWTWGNGEFGQAWDRNLTDEDGPYIELMTGVYTDNQPDFTWLAPYEEKSFTQYFMPYKHIGVVKNASIHAAVNLETNRVKGTATVQVYATSALKGAIIELSSNNQTYLQEEADLSPAMTYMKEVPVYENDEDYELRVTVSDSTGRLLIAYQPKKPELEQIPDAAKALPEPQELKTNEQLYLAGLHLEQYRHATFEPEAYYLEGLKRDDNDIRMNVAHGTLLFRRGLYEKSEQHFRKAIKSLTRTNPNPYDSEAYYQLGVSLKAQGRLQESFAAFYKSVWSVAWQDSGYFSLAQISSEEGRFAEALELVERSLVRNTHNFKARNLKAALLRKLGQYEAAVLWSDSTVAIDIADFGAYYEKSLSLAALDRNDEAAAVKQEFTVLLRDEAHNYLALASDYAAAGLYADAAAVVNEAPERAARYPMVHYAKAYFCGKLALEEEMKLALAAAKDSDPDYCFPNSLFDLDVLTLAVKASPADSKAYYYLGNLLYDKKRHGDAIVSWEMSRKLDDSYSVVHRNLALAYYNKQNNRDEALASLEAALSCSPTDSRVLYELDQLHKKLDFTPEKRLKLLEGHADLVGERDDLYLEYVTLHNTVKRHEEALRLLAERIFHPWEGGEGKVTGQYVLAKVELAKKALAEGRYKQAIEGLHEATVYPIHLGEGKLTGTQENHIYYYLGCAYAALGLSKEAKEAFAAASHGLDEPASAVYYNDQPPEMIYYQGLAWKKLENAKEAGRRFNKLIDYAEKHLFDDVKIDYFAVSLPDFLVFEDDLNRRNVVHCRYMMALGLLGMERAAEASEQFRKVLELDPNHQGAIIHREG